MRRDIGWCPIGGLVASEVVRYGAGQHDFIAQNLDLDNLIDAVNFKTVPMRDRMQREIKREIRIPTMWVSRT